MSKLIKSIPKKLTVLVIIILIPIFGFKACNYSYHLSLVPQGMRVWRVLYSKEEVYGFGPGGNEAGVIVYKLPNDVVNKIKKSGIDYFSTLPSVYNRVSWHGIYRTWRSTPIEQDWVTEIRQQESTVTPYTTGIANYLDTHGGRLAINLDMEKSINNTIMSYGNYYAYGRVGIIIVAPNIGKMFFVYSG